MVGSIRRQSTSPIWNVRVSRGEVASVWGDETLAYRRPFKRFKSKAKTLRTHRTGR
jgi:hypothetical protein